MVVIKPVLSYFSVTKKYSMTEYSRVTLRQPLAHALAHSG